MLKLKMTGKNFSPGILKLLHIRFVENGFKVWYNYVNINSICRYLQGSIDYALRFAAGTESVLAIYRSKGSY